MPRTVRGRRPGSPDTKAALLAAARRAFGERGFEGVSMRDIAREAGVDSALLHHYFGTKRNLYRIVVDASAAASTAPARVPGASGGERIVRAFLERWDAPDEAAALATLLRAGSDAEGEATLVELIVRTVVTPTLASFGPRQPMPKMRASLVGAQLLGLAWLRYAARVEPLASASAALLARTYGPAIDALVATTAAHGRDARSAGEPRANS